MLNGISRQCLIKHGLTVKREPLQGNLEIIERCTLVRGYPINIEYVHFQTSESVTRESQKFKGSHCQHNFDSYPSEWQRGQKPTWTKIHAIVCLLEVLGMVPGSVCMVCKCPTTKPNPYPILSFNIDFHLWYGFALWEGIVPCAIFSPRGRLS